MEKYFEFISKCGKLLGMNIIESEFLIKDPQWYMCYEEGMTPEESVNEYKENTK